MAGAPEALCRLYAILARDGRSAVVFRRGPSKQVQLLRWWLTDDRLEDGQWFKGRIYEHRCDLSPDGELLIYFAANWKGPHQSWTAVSRPPFLSALAIWPKGDAWGGGGVFDTATIIGLNHVSVEGARRADKQALWHPLGPDIDDVIPKPYEAQRWSEHAGRGEDNPLHHHRIIRDGWVLIDEGDAGKFQGAGYSWLFNRPEIYERISPQGCVRLRRVLNAIHQANGPWYVTDYVLLSEDGTRLRLIQDRSWADWGANGDLLFALGGSLYRLPGACIAAPSAEPLRDAHLIADLSSRTITYRAAPDWANAWPALA